MTDFQKFDGSLDVEKDKELLGILKEISTLFQQLFGGVSPEEGFKSVWDSDSFRSQKEELEKMASAGTLMNLPYLITNDIVSCWMLRVRQPKKRATISIHWFKRKKNRAM